MSNFLSALFSGGGILSSVLNARKVDEWNKEAREENIKRDKEGRALMDIFDPENSKLAYQLRDENQQMYGKSKDEMLKFYDGLLSDTKADYTGARSDVNSRYNTLIDQITGDYARERGTSNQFYNDLYTQQDQGYLNRQNEVMALLEGMGNSQKADINQSWKNQAAQGAQSMISRGLSGTTIMPTMNAGYERDKNADLARLEENLRTQKSGTLSALMGDRLASNYAVRSDQSAADRGFATAGLNDVNSTRATRENLIDNLLGSNLDTNTKIRGTRLNDVTNLNQSALDDWNTLTSNVNLQKVNDQNRRLSWIQSIENPYMDTTASSNAVSNSFGQAAQMFAPQPKQPKNNSWGNALIEGATLGFFAN